MNLESINGEAAVFSLFQIITGLVFGAAVLFLTFKVFTFWAKKRYGIDGFNFAFSILMGSILFSVGLLLQEIITPSVITFQNLLKRTHDLVSVILVGTLYTVIYFAISTLFSFMLIFVAYFLFTVLTRKINEMEEIKQNNVAISIILGIVIIVLVLLVRNGFSQLIDALIPHPELQRGVFGG
ncbi:MAG: DUF350 domain-containing protein [Spirochaetales bacterium]|nr:DUF350 domain-containing protein [Spirochaetales bacterium]